MDFFSDDKKKPQTETEKHKEPSTTELFSSAKFLAESLQQGTDKMDKAKAAKAAADLLDGASHYGKLDENQGLGKYLQKAEDYLDKYGSSTTITTTTTTTTPTTTNSTTTHSTTFESSGGKPGGDDGHSDPSGGGGYGQYLKMAEGFLKKD